MARVKTEKRKGVRTYNLAVFEIAVILQVAIAWVSSGPGALSDSSTGTRDIRRNSGRAITADGEFKRALGRKIEVGQKRRWVAAMLRMLRNSRSQGRKPN